MINLTKKEFTQIKHVCREGEYTFLPIFSIKNFSAPPDSITFIKIKNDYDYREFQKLRTNYPVHYFVCLVSIKNRALLFQMMSQQKIDILFYPVKHAEIKKINNNISEITKTLMAGNNFYNGLHYLDLEFSWKTIEINISIIAANFSKLLRQCNIYKNDIEEANIRLGLEEALVNAVEHGNLELDSSDKSTDLKARDQFDILKKTRYTDVYYNQRKIELRLKIENNHFLLSIENEGPGFDVSDAEKILCSKKLLNNTEISNPSGKGIWIIKNLFPSVKFEKMGRKIILSNKANCNPDVCPDGN